MKIHPLMLAAAIGFWGWQTGQWLVAVVVASLLCTSFYAPWRWPLSSKQIYRIADFCIVLMLGLGAVFYFTVGNPRVLVLLFQWLPLIFLPLALAHAYGTAEQMDLGALIRRLRRRPPVKSLVFDPWFPYFAMWLVAAAAANVRSEWFYVGLVALIAWPLLLLRPRSYRVGTWAVAVLAAVGLGYAVQLNLHAAQVFLEEKVPEWISRGGSLTDPYRSSTSMGAIGKLKESDAIVLRVETAAGETPPTLLHSASFDVYFDSSWLARDAQFERIGGGSDNRWPLVPNTSPARRITIYDHTARMNPVLSLPAGTSAIEGLKVISAERNRLGTVQIMRRPGFFSYVAAYRGDLAFEGPPTEEDLKLPNKEREAFEGVALKLGLKTLPTRELVGRVMQHFANNYEYSTFLESAPGGSSPVVDFLLNSRSGHCEYFATATVLLLRAGGVPARYATGFAVTEKSRLENAYIARQRHRHAWVHAYVNGGWVEIDTTPPSWQAIEAQHSGAWTRLRDLWSWARFRAAQAWANSDERQLFGAGLALLGLLAIWVGWRLYRSRRPATAKQRQSNATVHAAAGADSEYYRIEQEMSQRGWGRRPHETTQEWLARLPVDARPADDPLDEIVALHNRYRFDPLGLTQAQRLQLRDRVEQWLAALAARERPR